MALSISLHNANMDGPEPEIPQPIAPDFNAIFFTSLNPVIKLDRLGSAILSTREREISS